MASGWRVASRDELLDASGADPYVACEVPVDGVGLVGPQGWVALRGWDDHRAGATAVLTTQPDAAAGVELVAATHRLASEGGWRLAWFTCEDGIELPLAEPWQAGGNWVWMSTTQLADDDAQWPLVELDDDADAEELRAFALPINPLWEGDPGQGRNRYWLGARDETGRLIGCGTVHDTATGVGHLAGLVVDPAVRGRGLGRAITRALSVRVLASDGITTLSAYADNDTAIAVYRRVGYRLDHRFRSRFLEPRR
ncbi:MAG: GNAT family N-acetyltransferase [Brooklawnia sp.]|uniref:GNAT family N-acetyltransferase n=1 Tax=Brooklawnia sp. TaxID=2699740 RepID=UPI003C78BDFA